MRAARPPRCYGVSWLPVSASELILSSGSKIFSRASPIIRLPGLPSFYRTTGCPPKPDPNTPNRTGHPSALAHPGDSRTLTLFHVEGQTERDFVNKVLRNHLVGK